MLGCPLATPSNTLWFTEEHDRYWRRFYLAAGLSIAVHVVVVIGALLYQNIFQPAPELMLNMGAPDLPINVHVVMQQQQAAPTETVPQKKVVESLSTATAKNEIKTKKEVVPTEKVEAITKPVIKKETINKNTQGTADNNAQVGAPQKSEQVGINETVTVNSKPRFRSQPQQPEYPAQAKRRKQQGVVMVHLVVEPTGRISSVNVARSSGYPLLDAAAVKAVKQWKLYAHEINGQAVRARFTVPVEFKLLK